MDNTSWREKVNQFKIPIALSILGLVLIAGGIFTSGLSKPKPKTFPKESLVENQKLISIDVSGAVNKPGVYKLQDGSRIEDAVAMAGGFTEKSNQEYISKYLNMAQKLSDGTKVYVPFEGEQGLVSAGAKSDLAGGGSVVGVSTSTKVNINTASQSELEVLPGIGPVTASKIISDRPYNGVEDLLSKKVVSKSVFEKIKEQIVVY